MNVPEGIDLSWQVLSFLGAGATIVFLASWKLFNIRNADHEKFASDLATVKTDLEKIINKNHTTLDDRITRNREDIADKIEGKCEAIKKEIDRNERDNNEQYKELHGRMNKGSDELSEVRGDMREVRGELKVISKLVIDMERK